MKASALARIDHIVLAAPTLRQGMDRVEALLGIRPSPGGRHPRWGTHNALLSLGPLTYLEVVALDPEAERPAAGVPFGLEDPREPRLTGWALRTERIDEDAARLRGAFGLGQVEAGTRETPDGTVLSWRLSDPLARPLDGALPFLIDWGGSAHPARSAPLGGELLGFRIEHPEAGRVEEALEALGVTLDVGLADVPGLVARIRAPRGTVEMR